MEKIGKYQIIKKIGEGGMADVYLAKHPDLDLDFALKLMKGCDSKERFLQEAKIAIQASHRNIVKVHDINLNDDGLPFLVMEYVTDGALPNNFDLQKPLQVTEVIRIALDISLALEELEKLGVVHRDIKPENILKGESCYKLSDLGLAKSHQVDNSPSLTMTGVIMGTPFYISPEQAINSKVADIRSDIYSLGASLYHLLTGRPPFIGDDPLSILISVTQDRLEAPEAINPTIPKSLSALLNKMMEKEPANRYQSAKLLVEDLEKIQKDVNASISSLNASFSELQLQSQRPSIKWNSTFMVSTLFAVIVGVAISIFYVEKKNEDAQSNSPVNVINNQEKPQEELPKKKIKSFMGSFPDYIYDFEALKGFRHYTFSPDSSYMQRSSHGTSYGKWEEIDDVLYLTNGDRVIKKGYGFKFIRNNGREWNVKLLESFFTKFYGKWTFKKGGKSHQVEFRKDGFVEITYNNKVLSKRLFKAFEKDGKDYLSADDLFVIENNTLLINDEIIAKRIL